MKTKEPRTILSKPINKTPINKDSIEGMTPETDKIVKGTFLNVEYPGQPGKVSGRYYKGMQFFEKVMEDGIRYEIPLSVARYINERCGYEQHSYLQDDKGQAVKTSKTIPRYKFMIEQS